MRINKVLLFTAIYTVFGVAAVTPASAEVFMWRGGENHVTVTYPDAWRQDSNQKADDVFTVAAPGPEDGAMCRIRVREDRRFLMYPREDADSIQRINYSTEFWDEYAGEFEDARINQMSDNAGLGRAFASWAEISFKADGLQKRGLVYAGVYNDHAYILECSANDIAFDKWYHPFLSVLKSVDFRPEYNKQFNGFYRQFQYMKPLKIHGQKNLDMYVY